MSIELTKEELAAAEAGRKARLEPNNGGKWREPHPQYSSPVARGRVARGLSPFEPRVVKPNPEEVRKYKEEFSQMRADLNNPVIDTTLEYEEPIEVSATAEAGRKARQGHETDEPESYKNNSVVPAVDEYEKRRARGLAAVEEAMAANTQSNADRVIKDYQDAELARVVNSMKPEQKAAPVVDENVPIIDTTLEYEPPTEEMKKFEEEKKEAQVFSDYVNSIYSQSDYEADEKRKKAAKWITAAQMLGDSIAALGNSYFTAKGANAMKVEPGAQKAAAATSQLEQDIRTAREKAAKAKLDATLKKYEMEMQRKKDEQTQANWQKTFDANEAYRAQQQKNFEKTEARLAEQARLNAENEKIRIDIAKQNANIQLKNALDKNKPYPMAVNGEIYEIPIKKINEQIIGSIFAKLPEDVRMSAGQPIYGTDMGGSPIIKGYKNPSLADMLAAIGTYGNEETAKEIMKLAGAKVEEVDPKKDEGEDAPTNTTELPIQTYSAPAEEWVSQWRGRSGLGTTDFSQFKRK